MKNNERMNPIINLDNVVRVHIVDYSDYDPDNCHTGGQYLFWEDYRRVEEGWEVSYHTSAEFDYCPICGNFGRCDCSEEEYEIISDNQLLEEIQYALGKEDVEVTYTKEQQNTAMEHQPISRYKTEDSNAPLGDTERYTAFSYDRSRRWEISKDHYIILADKDGGEAFAYYPEDCSMEEDGYDVDLCTYTFLHSSEEVFSGDNFTDVYIDTVAVAMMEMSEKLGLGWKMENLYCAEEHSDYYRIYSKEFAEKLYIGEDVSFCYTEEALVGAV